MKLKLLFLKLKWTLTSEKGVFLETQQKYVLNLFFFMFSANIGNYYGPLERIYRQYKCMHAFHWSIACAKDIILVFRGVSCVPRMNYSIGS